jgi:hypothetical protein
MITLGMMNGMATPGDVETTTARKTIYLHRLFDLITETPQGEHPAEEDDEAVTGRTARPAVLD